MKKKSVSLAVLVLSSMMLTACGSTVQENTEDYFRSTGAIVKLLFSNSEDQVKEKLEAKRNVEEEEKKTALDAPSNFTVDDEGNYSFDSVEGAQYYLIYLCDPDAVSDDDTFLYFSDQIKEDGSGTYTGNLKDLMNYGYQEYLVKCYAFPDLMDEAYASSTASTAGYAISGKQSAPEIYYCWDAYRGVMGVQIGNIDTYEFEAYPQEVTVTFINTEDNSDVKELLISDVSADNYKIESDDFEKGKTYKVTAAAATDNQYITNSVSDETLVADSITLGDCNLYTFGYEFDDGFDRGLFNWPMVGEKFDPEEGGVGGISTAYSIAAYAPGRRDFELILEPKEAVEGSVYSYEGHIELVYQALDNEVIGAVSKLIFDISLYQDGTLSGSATGAGGIVSSTIKGNWIENTDGTLTLNYDHGTLER